MTEKEPMDEEEFEKLLDQLKPFEDMFTIEPYHGFDFLYLLQGALYEYDNEDISKPLIII